MTINWVGFRPSPKPVAGTAVHEASFEFDFDADQKRIVAVFSQVSLMKHWLGEVATADFRQGGLIKFSTEGDSGAFAQINLPKRLVIVSESLGQIDLRLKQRGKAKMSLAFRRALLPAEVEAWQTSVAVAAAKIEQLARGGAND